MKTNINKLSIPTRKNDVISKKIGEEIAIYDPENKLIHVVNETANFFLTLCNGSNTLKDIEKIICDTYEVSVSDNVSFDIQRTLEKFLELGIITFEK